MHNPLKHVKILRLHDGPVIDATNLTTISADDRGDRNTTERLAEVTRWHRRFMHPKREVIVSGARPDIDGIDWIRLNKWKGHYGQCYSTWCQRELKNHFDTPFVLVWQLDGFCLDPRFFSEEFYDYDYIGAPFHWTGEKVVGNGGFSMRSKKFCEDVDKLPDTHSDESIYFTIDKRSELVSLGVRFAPEQIGKLFSVELHKGSRPSDALIHGRFGFHGKNLLHEAERAINRWIDVDKISASLNNGASWRGGKLVRPSWL